MICCNRDEKTKLLPNEGFDFVVRRIIDITPNCLKFHNQDDYVILSDSNHEQRTRIVLKKETATSALIIKLTNISAVHMTKFRLECGNFHGGQVRLGGTFHKGVEECIASKYGAAISVADLPWP
jgi:hypothetical protein